MMSTSARQGADRNAGDIHAASTAEILDEAVGDPDPALVGRLQLDMLRAIYHELRHGHDQQALNTKAMSELADALDMLRHRLGDR
jgi:hypothetical protein